MFSSLQFVALDSPMLFQVSFPCTRSLPGALPLLLSNHGNIYWLIHLYRSLDQLDSGRHCRSILHSFNSRRESLHYFPRLPVTIIEACLWRNYQLCLPPNLRERWRPRWHVSPAPTPLEKYFLTSWGSIGLCTRRLLLAEPHKTALASLHPLALLALAFMLGFSAASVFSAEVTIAAGPERLVISDTTSVSGPWTGNLKSR
jgi:hypothetical protein